MIKLGFLKRNHHTQDKLEFVKLWELMIKEQLKYENKSQINL